MRLITKPLCGLAFLIIVLGCVVAGTSKPAWSDIMIMPVYALFTDRSRSEDITLVNTSNDEAVFRLEWIYQRQNENSSYTKQDTPIDPAFDFQKSVFFSPRQVTLPPSGKQNVRLSLRRPADLPDGEYHAHLRMQRLSASNVMLGGGPPKNGGVAIGLGVNIGYAVPVFVRVGKYDATATITEPQFLPAPKPGAPPLLQLYLERSGKHGTMGKIEVFWTPPGGAEKKIGNLNNVNVFTEITRRRVQVTLTEQSVAAGMVRVVYQGVGPDKGIKFDEKTFPVGG
jgi:fimbrial chaperone protein